MSDKEYITKRKIIDETERYKECLFNAMCALYEGNKNGLIACLTMIYNDINRLQNRIKISIIVVIAGVVK